MAASRTLSISSALLAALLLLLLLAVAEAAAPAGNLQQQNRQQEAPLRILAIGDSLTEGTTDNSSRFYPYGAKLQTLLQPVAPVLVDVQGRGGEHVQTSMRDRLLLHLGEASRKGSRYDWVLILGGINDFVGGNISNGHPEEVFHNLREMYESCLEAGSHVVAMTVLETKWTGTEKWDVGRRKVNSMIREFALRHAAQAAIQIRAAPRVLLLDLARLLPYVHTTEERRKQIFDDGVHLTEKGYDVMAELLREMLEPSLLVQQLRKAQEGH